MDLKEYLDTIDSNCYDFSRRCKLSHTAIYRVLHNLPVRPKTAKKIFKKSKGKVDYKNLFIPKDSSSCKES